MKRVNILFIAVIAITASCSAPKVVTSSKLITKNLVPLTGALIKEYQITPIMLKKFQYFTGVEPIVLEKEDSVKSAAVGPAGKVILKNEEIIRINPYTPAICLRVGGENEIILLFGNNATSTLVFGPSSSDGEKTYVLFTLNKGTAVRYDKDIRTVTSGLGSNIYIDPKQIKQFRVEPGRRVAQ